MSAPQAAVRKFALRFREFSAIDIEAGVIRDVAVITTGPALGHGMSVDRTTLEQVKACAETYRNGLKVKMTHAGDAGDIVGYLNNFRITGDQLLADLNLLKSSSHRGYILELAETIPDTFGLSISFSGPTEEQGDERFARCIEIYSADLVSEPAANPSGLFDVGPLVKGGDDSPKQSTPHQSPQFDMNPEDIKKIVTEALSAAVDPINAKLSDLEGKVATFSKPAEKPAEEPKQDFAADLDKAINSAAEAALQLFAKTYGAPVAPASAEPKKKEEETPKTFEVLVREHAEYSKDKGAAVAATVAAHPQAHAEYLSRVNNSGEVILF